jgi:F-box protein 11
VIIITIGISYFNERLPSEVLQYIFSFLRERDLVNIGKVCQRFHQIASMETLWKDLFHRVFEINLESLRPSRESSPLLLEGISWKTRFSIMFGCTHVYPKLASLPITHPLRTEASYVKYYSTITEAIENSPKYERILIHPGVYNESIMLDKPLALMGTGPEQVLLVSNTRTVIELSRGLRSLFISNMEIKFDAPDDTPNLRQYCVNIPGGAQPILNNCHFTNTSFC